MNDERSVTIRIGDEEYPLVLTTGATKEIAKRYGDIEKLGDKLMKAENIELALDEIGWLVTLLANQGVRIHNLKHRDAPRQLVTEEEVELLTTPFELSEFKGQILEAMFRGMKRNVESEDSEKNLIAGEQAPPT